MNKKAIAAGHICIDITPVFPPDTKSVTEIGQIIKPGKLVNMSAPDVHTGGSVANTGLGMKMLGADVRLMGKVGNDAFGGMIKDMLARYDADRDLIVEEGETTSYSVVIAVPGIDRVFLHCPGANDTFDGTEIADSALEDVALFHFGYPTLMRKMYADGGRCLAAMFRKMKEKGIATGLDLAAVDPDSEAGKADWMEILKGVLPFVDFFMPSFEELCFMLDRPKYEKLANKAGSGDMTGLLSTEDDIKPLAVKCLERLSETDSALMQPTGTDTADSKRAIKWKRSFRERVREIRALRRFLQAFFSRMHRTSLWKMPLPPVRFAVCHMMPSADCRRCPK